MCVMSSLLNVAILKDTCLHIQEKDHTNVMCVISSLVDIAILKDTCLHIQVKGHTDVMYVMSRAHSFPRQILPNSAAPFAKVRGSLQQILGILLLTATDYFRVHCADFGPVVYL